MKSLALSLLLLLPCGAYCADKPAAKQAGKPLPAPAVIPGFCIFGGQSGKTFGDLASFKAVIWKSDVVYAGGNSAVLKTQQNRLEILKAMRQARGSKIAVGFLELNIPLQPVLDEYTAGKLTEEEFLQKTAWRTSSGTDFSLYRPLFEFIIQNKLRALALNVPRELLFQIERKGLAGLGEEDRKFLPPQVNVSAHKKYLERLGASFKALAAASSGALTWEKHLEAVSAANEGAGARIAEFVGANPAYEVLVLGGNDQLVYNAAVPAAVKARTVKLRQASFYTEYLDCPAQLPKDSRDLANYVWYSGPAQQPELAASTAAVAQ